jgi:hypothetical protein
MIRVFLVAVVGTVLVVGGRAALGGGQLTIPGSSHGPEQTMPERGARNSLSIQRAQEMAKLRNVERQKRLVADTDRLVGLATELKTQVDQSTTDTLSEDGVKKVNEIEKLAHSVKERMKG